MIKIQDLAKFLDESNCIVLGINQVTKISEQPSTKFEETDLQQPLIKVHIKFYLSP